mmetsp:Transcript_17462/g.44490  ORF Transcript_17462/g.44490 Transcript_17462/m.44490 type:complete len:236 (-) Transcript_17462:101-808(-)
MEMESNESVASRKKNTERKTSKMPSRTKQWKRGFLTTPCRLWRHDTSQNSSAVQASVARKKRVYTTAQMKKMMRAPVSSALSSWLPHAGTRRMGNRVAPSVMEMRPHTRVGDRDVSVASMGTTVCPLASSKPKSAAVYALSCSSSGSRGRHSSTPRSGVAVLTRTPSPMACPTTSPPAFSTTSNSLSTRRTTKADDRETRLVRRSCVSCCRCSAICVHACTASSVLAVVVREMEP